MNEGGGGFKKEKGEKIFAMPIIFKQLSTGPQTRISKTENARAFHAVGIEFINYYYDF